MPIRSRCIHRCLLAASPLAPFFKGEKCPSRLALPFLKVGKCAARTWLPALYIAPFAKGAARRARGGILAAAHFVGGSEYLGNL